MDKEELVVGALYKVQLNSLEISNPMRLRSFGNGEEFLFEPRFFKALIPIKVKDVKTFILIEKKEKASANHLYKKSGV